MNKEQTVNRVMKNTVQSDISIDSFLLLTQEQVQKDITVFLKGVDLPENLKAAVTYACLNGGKRVRPALVYATYDTFKNNNHNNNDNNKSSNNENINKNNKNSSINNNNSVSNNNGISNTKSSNTGISDDARRAAMAVELLHCYSLIHDDLPCMDDDDLRRGVPTCHIAYGEAVALLAGDVLQTLAFEVLCADMIGFEQTTCSQALLSVFAPCARRMVAGQMRDLNAESQPNLNQAMLEQIHRDKTGALIQAAVVMGAICANVAPDVLDDLYQYAEKLGLAFQVQDDILDVTASTDVLGKPVGSDEKLNKSTYPKLLGVNKAQDYAATLIHEAERILTIKQQLKKQTPLLLLTTWLWQRKA